MAGGFEPPEHGGKPVFNKGIPAKFEFQLLPEDWDQFRKFVAPPCVITFVI